MASPQETQQLQAVGNYQLTELLGFNGVLATFKAFDLQTRLPAVVVAMHESSLTDVGQFEGFRDEFTPLISASASRVCQPFACGRDTGHVWAAYEWQTGHHLGADVRDQGLPHPVQALLWMAELADALATLHRRGTMHRILSPASIFITSNNQVKLLHCVWSRLALQAEGGVTDPSFMSVLPFLAPEIAGGDWGDEASDVYGIGANLYFLLTGMPPHWVEDPQMLVRAIQSQPVSFQGLDEVITPVGVELLEELLHREPEDRPLNLPALSDRLMALVSYLENDGTQRQPQGVTRLDIPATHQFGSHDAPSAPAGFGAPPPRADSSFAVQQPTVGAPPPQAPPRARTVSEIIADSSRELQAVAAAQAPPPLPPPPPAPSPIVKAKGPNVMLLGGIAAGVILLAIAAAVVVGMFVLGGEKEEAPPPKPVIKEVKVPRSGPEVEAKYGETVQNLNAASLWMVGYNRQYGTWPSKLEHLKQLGATDKELVDGWGTELEIREAYLFSAGPDKKWEDDPTKGDDIWIEAQTRALGGFSPTLGN